MEIVTFEESHCYDNLKTGITVSIILSFGNTSTDFEAKIDTGSSYCVFERTQAERLEIDVESGEPLRISTATGSFNAYGHELTLSVLESV